MMMREPTEWRLVLGVPGQSCARRHQSLTLEILAHRLGDPFADKAPLCLLLSLPLAQRSTLHGAIQPPQPGVLGLKARLLGSHCRPFDGGRVLPLSADLEPTNLVPSYRTGPVGSVGFRLQPREPFFERRLVLPSKASARPRHDLDRHKFPSLRRWSSIPTRA